MNPFISYAEMRAVRAFNCLVSRPNGQPWLCAPAFGYMDANDHEVAGGCYTVELDSYDPNLGLESTYYGATPIDAVEAAVEAILKCIPTWCDSDYNYSEFVNARDKAISEKLLKKQGNL